VADVELAGQQRRGATKMVEVDVVEPDNVSRRVVFVDRNIVAQRVLSVDGVEQENIVSSAAVDDAVAMICAEDLIARAGSDGRRIAFGAEAEQVYVTPNASAVDAVATATENQPRCS
jgi:hypothetical protein